MDHNIFPNLVLKAIYFSLLLATQTNPDVLGKRTEWISVHEYQEVMEVTLEAGNQK